MVFEATLESAVLNLGDSQLSFLDFCEVSRGSLTIQIAKIVFDSQLLRLPARCALQPFLGTVIVHLFLRCDGALTHFLIYILLVKFRNSGHCYHLLDAVLTQFECVEVELLVFGHTFDAIGLCL